MCSCSGGFFLLIIVLFYFIDFLTFWGGRRGANRRADV